MDSPEIYILAKGYAGFPCDPMAANNRQLDKSSLRYRYTLEKRDGNGPDDKLTMLCQPKGLKHLGANNYPQYMKIVEANRELLGQLTGKAIK